MQRPGYLRAFNGLTPKHKKSLHPHGMHKKHKNKLAGFLGQATPGSTLASNQTKADITAQVTELESGSSSTLPNDVINDKAQILQKTLSQYKSWSDSCSQLTAGWCLTKPSWSSCYDPNVGGCVFWDTWDNLNTRIQTLLTNHPLTIVESKPGIPLQAGPASDTLVAQTGGSGGQLGPLASPPSTVDQNFFSSFDPYVSPSGGYSYSLLAAGIPAYLTVLQNAPSPGPFTDAANSLIQLQSMLSSSPDGKNNPNVTPLIEAMKASVINQIRPGSVPIGGGPAAGDPSPAVAKDVKCSDVCPQTYSSWIPNAQFFNCLAACSDSSMVDYTGKSCCPLPPSIVFVYNYRYYFGAMLGLIFAYIFYKVALGVGKGALKATTFGILKK